MKLVLFSTLAILCGTWSSSAFAADKWVKTVPADLLTGDVVAIVDQTSSTALPNSNGESAAPAATIVTLSDDQLEITDEVTENLQWVVTVTTEEDGGRTYQFGVDGIEDYLYCTDKNNGMRVGTGTSNVFTIKEAETSNANDYLYNTGTSRYIGVYNDQDWRCYTTVHDNIKETLLAFYKLIPDSDDVRPATTISLGEYATTGDARTTIDLPAATVIANGADTVSGAAVTWSSSDETVATISDDGTQINLLKVGTTIIKATFAGDDNYKPSSVRFKLTVTPTKETITSLKALQELATNISTPVTIQFNDVFVTAVKGSNAYLADAQGYGILVYQNDHGLEVGQVLNGTIKANLKLYHSQTEIIDFSKDGLTITTTELTPTEMTIDQITPANQSALVTIKNVVFYAGTFSDGTNLIDYYDNFDVGWLEYDATYDITGIVVVYDNTLEICPRSEDDIVKIASAPEPPEKLDLKLSFPQEVYEITLGDEFTPPELIIEPADFDGMVIYSSSDGDVAKISYDGIVYQEGPGTTIITAEATLSKVYKHATASYTLIIKPSETPVTPDDPTEHETYDYTFDSQVFAENGEAMLADANWIMRTDAGYYGYDNERGQQFGSAKKPAMSVMLSTSDIPGTITKVIVNTCGGKDIDAALSVIVGKTPFLYHGEEADADTTSAILTNVETDYEFTGSASGIVTLSWTNYSSKAIFVKSIYVEYTTEEEPSGIADINAGNKRLTRDAGKAVYDLQGRILRSAPKKGLYIKDGKIVFVK